MFRFYKFLNTNTPTHSNIRRYMKSFCIDEEHGEDLCSTERVVESDEHFYIVPTIVNDIGLNPFEYRLYCEYRHISATRDASLCMTQEGLATLCGMSLNKLIECKKSLSKSRPELEGRSLIQIIPQYREDGSRKPDVIRLTDMSWSYGSR